MHAHNTPDTCAFGICRQPPTRRVETKTAIGGRIESLCAAHAQRRHELEPVLSDEPIVRLVDVQELLARSSAPAGGSSTGAILTVTRFVHEIVGEAMRQHLASDHIKRTPIDSHNDAETVINFVRRIGAGVEQAIEDHEAQHHGLGS